jgi:hypothetical protein
MEVAASISQPVATPTFRLRAGRLAAPFLLVVFAINLPVFLRMGLDSDVCMYDLCARGIERGQVHYRDQLETNFPGIVWIHLAVRALTGWSSEALRAFDLLLIGTAAWFLALWTPRSAAPGSRIFVASMLMAFYFSTTEWCHCQRDFWMLAPALAALQLRMRRTEQLAVGHVNYLTAFFEGSLWAVACWIKPHVALPAALSWFLSVCQLRRACVAWRQIAVDGGVFLAGGLTVGIAGFWWLVQTGAWPSFVEVMLDWNRDYAAYDSTLGRPWEFFVSFCLRFSPWIAAIVLALAAATSVFGRGLRQRLLLPAGFFLGWFAQAFFLQHPFDYVRAPVIFVGIGMTLAWAFSSPNRAVGRWTVALSLALLLASQVGLWKLRLSLAGDCLDGTNKTQLRDRVTSLWRVDWTDLEATTDFLRSQAPRDGEVTCFSLPVVPIYNELGLLPSTRFVFLHDHLNIFARHRDEIKTAVVASRQRWLVCDLKRFGGAKLRTTLDSETPNPWKDRAKFRSGQYVVFELNGPETIYWLEDCYGL